MIRILYLAEVGYRNAGDEVMWQLFQRQAKAHFKPGSYTLRAGQAFHHADPSSYDCMVLGGGSLLAPVYIERLHEALQHNKSIYIWGTGIDQLAGKPGLESVLSGSPPPVPADSMTIAKLNDLLNQARFAAVRGPLSLSFLRSIGCISPQVTVSGDPAFLLTPQDAAPLKANYPWPKNGRMIGINWGTARNRIFGENEVRVEDQLAAAAKQWIRKGYTILIFGMWDKDFPACHRLKEKIGHPQNVLFIETANPYKIMHMIGRCRFTVNFKLHAAVFSAVMRVPFVALGYRFKVFDFAASIDSLPFAVPTDAPQLYQQIMQLAEEIESNYDPIVQSLDRHISKYRGRLAKPFFDQFKKEERG